MNKRIFITGPSGIGKTTLAKYISETYNLPYVSTSASTLWPKYGFATHNEAHKQSVLNKIVGFSYQWDILNEREKSLSGNLWVTDRSPIDNVAYFLLTLGHDITECDCLNFIEASSKMLYKADGIIHLEWCDQDFIEDNGKRIRNSYYQEMVDSVINMVIHKTYRNIPIPILNINTWDFESRKQLTDKWLKEL